MSKARLVGTSASPVHWKVQVGTGRSLRSLLTQIFPLFCIILLILWIVHFLTVLLKKRNCCICFKYLSFSLTYEGEQYHRSSQLVDFPFCISVNTVFLCYRNLVHLFSCSNSKVQLFSNSYFSELGLFLLLFSCCVLLLCMISFGSLGRPSAQIVFSSDPLYLTHLSTKCFQCWLIVHIIKNRFLSHCWAERAHCRIPWSEALCSKLNVDSASWL